MKAQHTFVNGKRYHQTPIGDLPGVTTVLGNTKSYFTQKALRDYQERVGESLADSVLKEAIDRGNNLHLRIENYLESGTIDTEFTNDQHRELWNLMYPLVKTIRGNSSQFIERATWHSEGFAGSPDLVTDYKGKITIFDWKNSSRPKKRSYVADYILQICAYAKSVEETLGVKVEQGIIAVAVYPNSYIHLTHPDIGTIEPELQIFKITPIQLEKGWQKFKDRLKQYKHDLEIQEKVQSVYYW